MDPRIHYAQAEGGASIAFWQVGQGLPVIQLPLIPFSHIQMEWADGAWRQWYELLSGDDLRVLRYDTRGCGLSWAPEPRFSLEEMVDDLAAVASRAGLSRFSLLAPVQSAQVAIAYAATHPDRVERLVLWCGISRGDEMRTSSFEALLTLSRTDWGLFAEAAAHAVVAGWDNASAAHGTAAIMRESSSLEIYERVMTNYLETDISEFLPRVRCPVLVAYRSEGTSPLPSSARYLAATLPSATMKAFPGSSLLFIVGDAPEIAGAFREFFLARPTDTPEAAPGAFQTLLYTDVEGHTAIMQRLGDDRGREVLREHERITRRCVERHRGAEALTTGDGFLVRFSSAHEALQCAAELQRNLADASAELPVELRVRVGITAGEPIVEGDEIHGAVVFAARRIAAGARGGEVLVANVVRELAGGRGFAFREHGMLNVAGQEEELHLWEFLWAHTAS
ncbi:MAG: adenylate/guanylate cyclase domain-containing protein [Dehalococcoidia bacterium]